MDRNVRTSFLLSFYGGLLSLRQREYLGLHFDEDMSLAEIAGQFGVSRQAVMDSIRRGEKQLENMEGALGMLEKYLRMRSEVSAIQSDLGSLAVEKPAFARALERISRLPDILGG